MDTKIDTDASWGAQVATVIENQRQTVQARLRAERERIDQAEHKLSNQLQDVQQQLIADTRELEQKQAELERSTQELEQRRQALDDAQNGFEFYCGVCLSGF